MEKDSTNIDKADAIIYEISDNFTLKTRTSLLAMRGNEWYAEILGKEHRLYTPLNELSERKTGLYLNKGWTEGQLKTPTHCL